MSCFASPRTPILSPATHYSSCVGSFVKQTSKDSLIGTEIHYLKTPLRMMDESSDTETENDKSSLVNVVVVDSLNNPVAALPEKISPDTNAK